MTAPPSSGARPRRSPRAQTRQEKHATMKHIKLGDLEVSRIGLGAMGMSHGLTGAGTDDVESIRTVLLVKVAVLADVSTEWYTRLEKGHITHRFSASAGHEPSTTAASARPPPASCSPSIRRCRPPLVGTVAARGRSRGRGDGAGALQSDNRLRHGSESGHRADGGECITADRGQSRAVCGRSGWFGVRRDDQPMSHPREMCPGPVRGTSDVGRIRGVRPAARRNAGPSHGPEPGGAGTRWPGSERRGSWG